MHSPPVEAQLLWSLGIAAQPLHIVPSQAIDADPIRLSPAAFLMQIGRHHFDDHAIRMDPGTEETVQAKELQNRPRARQTEIIDDRRLSVWRPPIRGGFRPKTIARARTAEKEKQWPVRLLPQSFAQPSKLEPIFWIAQLRKYLIGDNHESKCKTKQPMRPPTRVFRQREARAWRGLGIRYSGSPTVCESRLHRPTWATRKLYGDVSPS